MKNTSLSDRIRHSVFGFALGDCLGVPYEFKSPGSFAFKPFDGYGTHGQPHGTWSDDTALMLTMLDAFPDGDYDEALHQNNLRRFMKGEYSVNGVLFDVGNATWRAIQSDFTISTDDAYGNGGLLRIWPMVALSCSQIWDDEKEYRLMCRANGLTHSVQELYMSCCRLYCDLLKNLYMGEDKADRRFKSAYRDLAKRADFKRYQRIEGHICNAIANVFDTFFRFPNYTDIMAPMKAIIEKGCDTDSNAALLGALLGAKKPIPEKYIENIRDSGKIDKFVNHILATHPI